jgi:putative GTP pyrophosphokinase
VQIRTIAMDFWASLEHKIFYKYNQSVPAHLLKELKEAAETATALDRKMEKIHKEILEIKESQPEDLDEELKQLKIGNQQFQIPEDLLRLISGT